MTAASSIAVRSLYVAAPDAVTGAVAPVHEGTGTRPFLVADVGGTHARVGLFSSWSEHGLPELLAYAAYRCGDHPHLEDIISGFCADFEVQPRELVLACAGYLHAGVVINAHLAWPVVPAMMGETLGFDHVRFLNDFEALAHATAHIGADTVATIKASHVPRLEAGPIVIIGPGSGSGLGAAVWFPGNVPRVMATQAGQMQLAARSGLEQQVLAQLASANSHTPYESILSDAGLVRLYIAICAVRDRYPSLDEAADITAAALTANDEMASEALTLFCGWLGSFASDLALLYGATGGVYFAGGFLSRISDFMRSSPLVERFLDKGVMRPFLKKIPIRVVDPGQFGLLGAASWYLDAAPSRH